MALDLFDSPLFAQRKYFMQEITGLDDAFDLLDEWPTEQRDLSYETVLRVCRDAAAGTYHVRFESPPVHHHFRSFRRAWPFRRRLCAADRNLYRHRPSSLVAARGRQGGWSGMLCFLIETALDEAVEEAKRRGQPVQIGAPSAIQ
ncbi:DUF982 domain-containing protein|uniref:DUF982 domain-containing protein n=1 Tax=Rhizobium altiplani TaxID=1864509 RepID=UPI0009EC6FD6|nr:DUF982 domain-containing protein [Rhizobium altiplani]